jgi:hypothetical protein
MANVLEDAMSTLSRKEALAARWLLQPQDVAPILGPLGAQVWSGIIQQIDVHGLAREFDYRIEAGSARKPNKAGRVEQMNLAMQNLGPLLQGLLPMGQVGPMNALLSDWCKSLDLDPKPYMIPEPPPPPPPGPPPGPPAGESGASPEESGGGAPPPEPQQMPPEFQ